MEEFRATYSRITRAWLDTRYRVADENGIYLSHEPIYGLRVRPSEPGHARRLLRLYDLLRVLRLIGARSLLDVGGSEGYFAFLCRELLGMSVVSADISIEACHRAFNIFQLPTVALNAAYLPFGARSFDVVLLAEVVEHLAEPIQAILAAERVARKAIVVSTEEWHASSEARDHILAARTLDSHTDRNALCSSDLRKLFAPLSTSHIQQRFPERCRGLADDAVNESTMLSALIGDCDAHMDCGGAIIAASPTTAPDLASLQHYPDLARRVLRATVPLHAVLSAPTATPLPTQIPLACPRCLSDIGRKGVEVAILQCAGCGSSFPVRGGIPDLFVTGADETDMEIPQFLEARGYPPYATQARDLIDLDRQFKLEPTHARQWDLTLSSDQAAWTTYNAHFQGSTYVSENDDPQLISPWLCLDSSVVRAISLEYRVDWDFHVPTEANRTIEVFLWFEDQMDFQRARCITHLGESGSTLHEYNILMPDESRFLGRFLVKLRLDLLRGPFVVRDLRVRLHCAEGGEGQ